MKQSTCNKCLGTGRYLDKDQDSIQLIEITCDLCKGTGKLEELEASDIGKKSKKIVFYIDESMCQALRKFLIDNGYISHEFHPQIHELVKQLNAFLGD